ncbi:LDH2 family malate/lactate/ureidoglycolate dehydrogenase [Kribbella amoyensis]|uniref:LDH2 family malate/lactate/ureidoglycolate dehydrogenase n=1 Tax=Kribbella amoyensis TaxID=996641 RepID=A0A561BY10_9ACTN|nr:Ldh family oxidoreductase [Kribbella amoyensis]TWD83757.1 LDH2 family malate/lactate/ureidoglycolate dehydrogenase [Kribbella amoyensis]
MTAQASDADRRVLVRPAWLEATVSAVFTSLGFDPADAAQIAHALVDAELRGVSSHGILLVPMYVERLNAGGVTRERELDVLHDAGAAIVADARGGMGQLTSPQAMGLAIERAGRYGIGLVSVRNAHHFGAASRWAMQAAEAGCLGVAMSNTTPLMPAPGGAERIVGNNPLAIAVPTQAGPEIVLDMALSAVALGKIRLAASAGRPIPDNWATDPDGVPTTDPEEAVLGMLLPAAGHKGFGLALMIDVLTGVLSGGGWGDEVRPLYREPDRPNDCAHLFLAIDPELLGGIQQFRRRSSDLAERVRGSATAPGVDRLYLPGEIEAERARQQRRTGVLIERSALDGLLAAAQAVGAVVPTGGEQN